MMKIEDSLGYLLNSSAKLIKRTLDAQLKMYDITSSQWAVLSVLSVEDELSQAEVADKINSDRATCGTIIDKLVSKKLVEKKLSENDRRSYNVKLLPKAVNIISEVSSIANSVNDLAVIGLSASEIQTLVKCLNIIMKNLDGGLHK
ncbi:MarR family winged helix-turn-helix transcriptional regulator [Streptococcus pantholopis]|nr:MarR family transcriptional regulator [Streptococcus pantholopis]